MSLSQNIKKLRLEKGLTQEQLALKLGVSAQAVSKWENSETYPDGALLTPLAQALGASLDTLFDNNTVTMADVSSRIMKLIDNTDREDRIHLARDICWQIEKGLFGLCNDPDYVYTPDELKRLSNASSYILSDNGFTHVSNGRSPFFALFPRYGNCYGEVLGDGTKAMKIFSLLSSPDTMRAVMFIHHCRNYVFEAEALAEECKIDEDRLDKVMQDLTELGLVSREEFEIDGAIRTLYFSEPTHLIIALMLIAHEFSYKGSHQLTSDNREIPYLG